jgi:hypothetical protein
MRCIKGISKTKLTRWFLPSLLAIVATFALLTPVLAAISPPDDISIDAVYVYGNCRQEGDQLYLVQYTITYSSSPGVDSAEAFICRLMDGTSTLQSTYPVAYHDDGYGEGVIALYFTAADAPTWEGSYTMELLGNPFEDWSGGIPEDTMLSTAFNLWQDSDITATKSLVAARIITMAFELDSSWGVDMVTTSDAGRNVLTSYAAGYFINVVPYISDIAPTVFAEGEGMPSETISPDIPSATSGTGYLDYLKHVTDGTPLDFTDLAADWGMSRGAVTAVFYYGILAICMILIARKLGSYKPVMAFSIPLVILGAFISGEPMVTILAGFMAIGMVAYIFLYKPSPA